MRSIPIRRSQTSSLLPGSCFTDLKVGGGGEREKETSDDTTSGNVERRLTRKEGAILCELEKTMDRGGLGEPSPELRTGLCVTLTGER